jgi:hypothetical protein
MQIKVSDAFASFGFCQRAKAAATSADPVGANRSYYADASPEPPLVCAWPRRGLPLWDKGRCSGLCRKKGERKGRRPKEKRIAAARLNERGLPKAKRQKPCASFSPFAFAGPPPAERKGCASAVPKGRVAGLALSQRFLAARPRCSGLCPKGEGPYGAKRRPCALPFYPPLGGRAASLGRSVSVAAAVSLVAFAGPPPGERAAGPTPLQRG